LASGNPFDAPIIDPNYFSEPNDLEVLLRGTKLMLEIGRTAPLASVLDPNETGYDNLLHTKSDDELREVLRQRMETLYHPTSTARMAPLDEGGVVDAQLKVYGLENVRVVDASVFPNIPAGHTSAPVIAVAEAASDIIKASL